MKGEGEDGGGCGSEEREGVGERPPYHRGGSIWVVPDAWLPGTYPMRLGHPFEAAYRA